MAQGGQRLLPYFNIDRDIPRRDDELRQEIKRVHESSFGLYGTRKVWHQLRREGIVVAKCTVERLMCVMGLEGVRRGKTTVTTVSDPKAPCPLDKVNREFRVSRPNALWVVDFTYGAPRPGWSGVHMTGML
jgi:transposase InsO family protein